MNASEWFDKRDKIAEAFNVTSEDVPAEAVWFLSLEPQELTWDDINRARLLHQEIREHRNR